MQAHSLKGLSNLFILKFKCFYLHQNMSAVTELKTQRVSVSVGSLFKLYVFCIIVMMMWSRKTGPLLVPVSSVAPQPQCLRSLWQQCWASWLLSLYCLLECTSTGSVHQSGSEYMPSMSLHTCHRCHKLNASVRTDSSGQIKFRKLKISKKKTKNYNK